MKKQNTLAFLVKHLDHWPKRLGGAPNIGGYFWRRVGESIKLADSEPEKCESMEQITIDKKEWKTACIDFQVDLAQALLKQESSGDIYAFDLTDDESPPVEINYIDKLKQKIYVCGPMTGYDQFNRKAFNDAALKLSLDYIVLNPAILPDGLSQKEYMQIDIAMIQCCDAIYLLDGWDDSLGANAECSLAEKLGLTIILETK